MSTFTTFSVLYTFFFLVCPLAYYTGYYAMALVYAGPNMLALWLSRQRLFKASDAVVAEYWKMTIQRRAAP